MANFFVIKHTTVENEYLTNTLPMTWGIFEDAIWTYNEQAANNIITENSLANAEVETFVEPGAPMDNESGGTQPPTRPPF